MTPIHDDKPSDASMRRVIYPQFGGPEVLQVATGPVPEPAPGQVLIRVHGAGLNPIDWKTRKGLGFAARQIESRLPWTPGYDVAGEVAAVGAGVTTLVFTVDMPVPGARYRDAHSGMSGPNAAMRRYLQAVTHPRWAFDVGLLGKPHDLGNISAYRGNPTGLEDYIGWLGSNFDPSISWKDLEWIRDFWDGPMVIKGILDPEDARDAVRFGADGIVVSNHGGRQLDGVLSSARALPAIADAVKGDLKILVDSGIRTGLDVVRMLALGADCTMLGRAFIYALAADGQAGVTNLLELIEKEMRVAMVLTGAKSISEINADLLVAAS